MSKFSKAGEVVATPGFMQVNAIPEGAETPAEQAQANGGELSRFLQDAGGGGVEITPDGGVKRLGGGDIQQGQVSQSGFKGDIMSTLVSKTGSPLNDLTQVTDDCRVRIAGQECTVATALRMGVLTRGADGALRDATTGHAQLLQNPKADLAHDRQEQVEAQNEQLQPHDFTKGSHPSIPAVLQAMNENMGKNHAESLLIRAMSGAGPEETAGLSPQAVSELATAFGIEQADAVDALKGIRDAYHKGAARYIDTNYKGVDGMEVLTWLDENISDEGASRFMTSLVAGSSLLVDHAVKAFIQQRGRGRK